MSDDIARQAHVLLKQAIELEESQRAPFVESGCNGDRQLYKMVMSMLGAITASHGFLEKPALGDLRATNFPAAASSSRDRQQPDAVGDYLIVGVLGVGGMATVYEAIQDQPKRRVALKVLHQGMTQSRAYERFVFETEALARLHHPGIAQIYEAGAAPLGPAGPVPFFAMELIPDAVPLTTFADRHALSLRERLEMIVSVCDAVHHGHQHGVIHRDLKPGNVLVDREGRAKVIDFGIAMATEPNAESLTAFSDVRHLIGTLNYMSPEQCDPGSDIDIRTDVYSLGVLLHEIVCDQLPLDLTGRPLPAALNMIVHEPPVRFQSRHAAANRDLAAIIHKALAKDPDLRYDSASALASDLRRWMSHQAIEARPPGAIDQCRLFAKRHRALVAGGLSIMASIVLVATLSTVFAVRLSDEVERRGIAEQQTINERDQARWQAYTAQIAGALSAMKTKEFLQMRSRLAEVSYPNRGWEWGFLARLSEQSSTTLQAHNDMIFDLAVSQDWTRLATAANDGSVRVWNADDQSLIGEFTSASGARAHAVDFTSDGQRIVTGDGDGIVRLLDAATLREIEVVAKLPSSIRTAIGLPENRIAAAAADGTAMIWTLEPRSEVQIRGDQPGGVRGVAVSSDGLLLATFNELGSIWVRNASDLSVIHRLEFPGNINQVRFDCQSRMLGAGGTMGRLIVWRLDDGSILDEIDTTGGINTVRSLAFSNDGALLAAGLVHRGIVIYSIADRRVIHELGGHTEAVSGLRFRPDDKVLVSSSWDRTIRTWRTDEFGSPGGAVLKGHHDSVYGVSFSPEGSMIASVSTDGSVILWDPDRSCALARLSDNNVELHAVAFSPDGRYIAAGCADRIVRIWDTTTGLIAAKLPGHRQWVSSVAFDSTSTRVAAGGQSGDVLVWDLQTRERQIALVGHSGRVNSVQFSPDDAVIATGSRDKTVRIWNAQTGHEMYTLTEHESDVFAVLFSHDGRRLYSGSRDQTVRVWDVATGICKETLAGHGQFVTSLALNSEGSRLAAGSWFGDVVLFDMDTSDQIASFRTHEAAVRGVAFSPDGRWLATASLDQTVRLFDSASRVASDNARQQATAAFAAALEKVQPLVDQARGNPATMRDLLAHAQLDPDRDPWVRKAVVSSLAPVDGPR